MKISKTRALNNMELYCCNMKSLKNIFKDRDVDVSFGSFQYSRNMTRNSLYHFPKGKGKIVVLALFTVEKRREGYMGFTNCSRLSIQSIDKNSVPNNLQERFEKEALPKMVEFFDKHIDYDVKLNQRAHELIVGIEDLNFKFYEKQIFKMM